MLEGGISTGEKALQVPLDTSIGFRPVLDEYRVVTNYKLSAEVTKIVRMPYLLRRDCQELQRCSLGFSYSGESVNGMRTSNTPRFKR